MYKHSFRAEGPYQGEFHHPQQALDAGRGMYGDVAKVWVGQLEPAYFSDMFVGGAVLLAYMQEEAESHGEMFADSFELPAVFVSALDKYIKNAIGEWEADLPDELQFKGEIIKKKRGYTQSAMVRPADFA